MSSLKLVRAFTFVDQRQIIKNGLNIPNEQNWNIYRNNNWPDGLAFESWSLRTQSVIEALACTIAKESDEFVFPAVGIITCHANLFDQFKEGLTGIQRIAGGKIERISINNLGDVQRCQEFVLKKEFLTPDWLRRLDPRIGFPIKLRGSIETKYFSFDFLTQIDEVSRRSRR